MDKFKTELFEIVSLNVSVSDVLEDLFSLIIDELYFALCALLLQLLVEEVVTEFITEFAVSMELMATEFSSNKLLTAIDKFAFAVAFLYTLLRFSDRLFIILQD